MPSNVKVPTLDLEMANLDSIHLMSEAAYGCGMYTMCRLQ